MEGDRITTIQNCTEKENGLLQRIKEKEYKMNIQIDKIDEIEQRIICQQKSITKKRKRNKVLILVTVFESEVPEIRDFDSSLDLEGRKRKGTTSHLQKGHGLKKGEGKPHEPCLVKTEESRLESMKHQENNQMENTFAPNNPMRINQQFTQPSNHPILMPRKNVKQIQNISIDKTKRLRRRRNKA